MSATITWSVKSMHTVNEAQPNIVHLVVVSVKAEQDGFQAVYDEPLLLERPTGDFTPYEQLTQEQVLQWVFDILTPAGVAQREYGVSENVAHQINPPQAPAIQSLPWTTG